MADEIPREKFAISIGQKTPESGIAIPLGDVVLVNEPPKGADASFYEWMMESVRRDPVDLMPLCVGARIVVDENGDGTLTIDESLPDGVWLVTQNGKTFRYEGVTGPVRARSHAEHGKDIEVSPVALTFETRK